MQNLLFGIALLFFIFSSCKKEDTPPAGNSPGDKMLLIGNSFFRPYAEQLDVLALDAGLSDHNSIRITRGGDNGRPINFWNDSTTAEHLQIKAALDEGDIDIFGMTSGHDSLDRVEGHRAWIQYALQNNPDIAIFIAIPTVDFPDSWDQRAQDYGFTTIQELYTFFVNDIVHDSMVTQLRAECPSTKIFTIPTGWAAIDLAQMLDDNLLLDNVNFSGAASNSLFTDTKGHQGDIVVETGGLVWLSSLYGIDLNTFDYQTGFNTDLHAVAKQIVDEHDPLFRK